MYTKDIELVDVTDWAAGRDKLYHFRQLEGRWKKHRKIDGQDMCSRIVNPVSFELTGSVDDYVNAFHFLLQHEFAYRLSVKNPGPRGWMAVKITPDEVKDFPRFLDGFGERVAYMAKIAYEDRLKDKFLEIKFRRCDEEYRNNLRSTAKIEFREHEGRLIGYQCVVPYQLEDLFTVSKKPKARAYTCNHGMWVPDDFEIKPQPDDEEPPAGVDPLKWALRKIK